MQKHRTCRNKREFWATDCTDFTVRRSRSQVEGRASRVEEHRESVREIRVGILVHSSLIPELEVGIGNEPLQGF